MVGLSLVSCAGVTVKDSVWCGSLGAEGAFCSHTLTNETKSMTLQQFAVWWDDLSDPKVATSVSTLAEWKADIEKLCSFTQACTSDVKSQVDAIYNKISAAHKTAKKVTK